MTVVAVPHGLTQHEVARWTRASSLRSLSHTAARDAHYARIGVNRVSNLYAYVSKYLYARFFTSRQTVWETLRFADALDAASYKRFDDARAFMAKARR